MSKKSKIFSSSKESTTSIKSNFLLLKQGLASLEETIPVLGIDLGTTFSCVGTWRNSKVEIIPNESGTRTSPSIVCFKDKEILIGESAKNNMYFRYIDKTIINSKRFIGKYFIDPNVQNDIKKSFVKIIKDPITQKPNYCININEKEERRLSAEEVASMILKYIKKYSEDFIGKEVKKAVITVPAHFNNSQREATKEAARNAGLEVIRIINEPTAAAIAYGYENESNEERKVLVFDLGGGTFDVSILKIKKYEFTVLSSCGDDHLGGEDFTKEFTDYLMKLFKQEYPQFEKIDFYNKEKEKEYKVFTRLKEEAEKAKKILSNNKSANIDLDGLYKKDFAVEIKRGDFEELCSHLWNKCIDYIKKALIDANLKKEDLDEVILIGGSSRIPKVQEIVENFIRGKDEKDNKKDNNKNSELKPKISKAINADEAVAMGAAIVACIENDNNKSKGVNLTINDITSKSIGIGTDEGKMEIIIPKGTILPVREKPLLLAKYFSPKSDYAKGVSVKIYESDNDSVNIENLLKQFPLTNFPLDVKEKVVIKILMHLDHNGIIKVDAKINDVLIKEECNIKPSFCFK